MIFISAAAAATVAVVAVVALEHEPSDTVHAVLAALATLACLAPTRGPPPDRFSGRAMVQRKAGTLTSCENLARWVQRKQMQMMVTSGKIKNTKIISVRLYSVMRRE